MTRCSSLQLLVSARKVLLQLIVALTGVGASTGTLAQECAGQRPHKPG